MNKTRRINRSEFKKATIRIIEDNGGESSAKNLRTQLETKLQATTGQISGYLYKASREYGELDYDTSTHIYKLPIQESKFKPEGHVQEAMVSALEAYEYYIKANAVDLDTEEFVAIKRLISNLSKDINNISSSSTEEKN